MHCSRVVFVLAALLAVTCAVPVKNQVRDTIDKEEELAQPQLPPVTPEEAAKPTVASEAEEASAASAPPAVNIAPPEPIAPQIPEVLTPPPRRVITFDQRQEGKYNVRADLENFMIVVIPSSPASGASLLDLLSRTNQKKSHHGGKYSHHKKYLAPSKPTTPEDHNPESSPRIPTDTTDDAVRRYQTAAAKQHFIEGRTPYHVDISSSGELQQAQNRRLDATPMLRRSSLYGRSNSPVYRLMPTDSADQVMAVLPIKGNHAVTILGVDGVGGGGGNAGEASGVAGPRRLIRSLTSYVNQNEVYHNSVVNRGPIDEDSTNYSDEVESNRGFVDLTDTSNSFDSLNVGNVDRFATAATDGGDGDGWDRLTLLGAQEQCGPDRRRDSYGVCQFVPLD